MLFVYSLRWWFNDGFITSSGIIYGEDMADATRRLTTEIYEDIEDIHLFCIEDGDSGYISMKNLNAFLKEHPLEDED